MKRFVAMTVLALLLPAATANAVPDVWPPSAPALNLTMGKTTAVIRWTAPGDDCGGGGAAQEYDLRYSTSEITEGNFSSATQITTSAPQSPGSSECADVTELTCGTTYYFALKVRDAASNWSPINPNSAATGCGANDVAC